MPPHVGDEIAELAGDEPARRLDAAVEIDCREQRLVAVGQQRLFPPPAGLLLAFAEQQMLADAQTLGLPRQRRRRHQRRLRLRLLAFVELGELVKEQIGDDESEQRVAQELHRLVVDDPAADVLVGARRVRHRVLEQPAVLEAVADRLLQRLELVAETNDLAVLQLGPVALDDPERLVRLAAVDGDAHVVESLDRQGKDGMRDRRRQHRHDAVRFEQPAYDLRFDFGVRAEDDLEIGHDSLRISLKCEVRSTK